MSWDKEGIDQRLEFLQELIQCNGPMNRWIYDAEGTLLWTNCNEMALDKIIRASLTLEYAMTYAINHDAPLILSHSIGTIWGAVFEREDGQVHRIHILGPVFSTSVSNFKLRDMLYKWEMSDEFRQRIVKSLQNLPVIRVTYFLNYVMMLEYTVTGHHVAVGDIVYQYQIDGIAGDPPPKRDGVKVWMNEQALMQMVRDGSLDNKSALDQAVVSKMGVRIISSDNLMQARVSQIVFVSNTVRAAIEGGVSPDIAYSMGDTYIQNALNATTLSQLVSTGRKMFDDFIQAVRRCQSDPDISRQIQSCRDYIDLHVEERIELMELAKRVGYTNYYLSHKFKKETGVSVNDYIKSAKLERAKLLLTTTQESIQSISDRLSFSARSTFANEFKKATGYAPGAYREKFQKL